MASTERSTQYGKALRGLRKLILSGEFPINNRLPETALAKRLEISRTPLRQAMDRLVDEGLLERIETGGCRVVSFSMTDIFDAIEMRGVVEGAAARIAAERGPDPDVLAECCVVIARLDQVLQDRDSIDFESYVAGNAELHRLFSMLAGSSVIAREVERVSRLPLASPSAFLQGQEFIPDFQVSLRRAQEQHKAILSAIVNREGARAEALTREHARLARVNLEFVMNEGPSLTGRVPGLALVAE